MRDTTCCCRTVADWNSFAPLLAGHRVVAVDLRGHDMVAECPDDLAVRVLRMLDR